MKSHDYEAVVIDCEVFCTGCIPEGTDEDEVCPIFADSEWDSFPVCTACGEVHNYVGLTEDGMIHEAAALDAEIFFVSEADFRNAEEGSWQRDLADEWEDGAKAAEGWYFWFCLPGCLPSSEAEGPYKTKAEAAWQVVDTHTNW